MAMGAPLMTLLQIQWCAERARCDVYVARFFSLMWLCVCCSLLALGSRCLARAARIALGFWGDMPGVVVVASPERPHALFCLCYPLKWKM